MTDDLVAPIRGRLSEIATELSDLADNDFAGKHKLNTEADDLKKQIDNLTGEENAEAARQWAERAGRKEAHTQNTEVLKAMAQRIEGGGTGGT